MTTALYRRYRPESFAEVIGQDHVTAPLRQALRSGQTNHAYLFSGPRGCGKTTSARILARCLNCAEGPTDTPCGVCPSCVELARGGPGSLDVVEIDAASHGGVDDARELRERATFAPARDRYKVFILDEAHMVSPQGFNALLKIVEEPPPHVKFIFATTEPDKVIGTIRSRTHHYPFRLVPPDVLLPYLEHLCTTEGVPVGAGVLSLVVRAGGGSVRDTLSVLDQLVAGAGESGLEYEGAVALLGYTHTSLLDDLVDAIAARDGASAFRVVERVVATGHEPRRFVEDLLERLRDLIVIAASGEAAAAVLRDVPPDQLDRMRRQATHLGASELSRSADLANAALTEMVGATSPRLHLELLMARLLLPSADDASTGLAARLDRLERGVPAVGGAAVAAAPAPVAAVPPAVAARPVASGPVVDAPASHPSSHPSSTAPGATPPVREAAPEPASRPGPAAVDERTSVTEDGAGPGTAPGEPDATDDPSAIDDAPATGRPGAPVAAPRERAPEPADAPERPVAASPAPDAPPARPAPAPASASSAPATTGPSAPATPSPAAAPSAPATPPAAAPAASGPPAPGATAAAADTEMLRRRWPDVLTTLRRLRLPSWALVNQHAQILELDATTLRLGFAQPGLVTTFRGSNHGEAVARALSETLGVTARVEAVLDEPGGARASSGAAAADVPTVPATISPERAAASWDEPVAAAPPAPPAPVAEEPGTSPDAGAAPRASAAGDRAPGRADRGHPTSEAPAAGDGAGTDEGDTSWPAVAAPGSGARGATPAAHPGADESGTGPASGGDRPVPPWEPLDGESDDAPAGAAASGSSDDDASDASRPGAPVRSDPSDVRGADRPAGPRGGDRPAGAPVDADRPPGRGDARAPRDAGRASAGPPVVAHHDDDIPPGDEPDDPWQDGPPRTAGTASRPTPSAAGPAAPSPGAAPAPSAAAPSTAPAGTAAPGGTARERGIAAARAAAAQSRRQVAEPDEPSPDDPTIGQSGLVGVPLVTQVLGGRVIDEQVDL